MAAVMITPVRRLTRGVVAKVGLATDTRFNTTDCTLAQTAKFLCDPPCPLGLKIYPWLKIFEKPRCPHPPAHTHSHHPIARTTPLQFPNDCRRQLRPGTTQRMTQSNGPAIGIHALWIEPRLPDYRQ